MIFFLVQPRRDDPPTAAAARCVGGEPGCKRRHSGKRIDNSPCRAASTASRTASCCVGRRRWWGKPILGYATANDSGSSSSADTAAANGRGDLASSTSPVAASSTAASATAATSAVHTHLCASRSCGGTDSGDDFGVVNDHDATQQTTSRCSSPPGSS